MSSRRRLVVVPLVIVAVLSGATFALAKLHLAKPGIPKAAAGATVQLGDQYRGETIFGQTCAGCHGDQGKGGGSGPKLQGLAIPIAAVKAQIEHPVGTMPANLVSGQQERDVLAYVATLLAPAAG